MRRRHAVATSVKDATCQERLRVLPGLGMIGPLPVKNRLKQRAIGEVLQRKCPLMTQSGHPLSSLNVRLRLHRDKFLEALRPLMAEKIQTWFKGL
jgi:hypothetical protein